MKRLFMCCTMFFGLAFDIKSKLTVASRHLSSMILSAAYMNWIDPEIKIYNPFLILVNDSRCYCSELWSICIRMILGFVSLLLIFYQ
jgi:hypothetical protein